MGKYRFKTLEEFEKGHAPEMLVLNGLPEKWYIRGCDELRNYFESIDTDWGGGCNEIGYYANVYGGWNTDFMSNKTKKTNAF